MYAPEHLETQAGVIAKMLSPADVRIVKRVPGTNDGISVFVASSFDGVVDVPQEVVQEQQTLEKDQKVDWVFPQALDQDTPLRLEAPWRGVHLRRVSQLLDRDDRGQALRRLGRRGPDGAVLGLRSIQAMRWDDLPAIENP